MKVLGWTDAVTACDCCGKSRLSGTFGIERDGVTLYFGPVCVRKTYGKKKGGAIVFEGKRIADVQRLPWQVVVDRLHRGYFAGMFALGADGKSFPNNGPEAVAGTVAVGRWNGKSFDVVRSAP